MWLLALPAHACSVLGPRLLTVDPTFFAPGVPAPPEIVSVDVLRGGSADGSCADLAFVRIEVARPAGDPHGEDEVGYRFALRDGALPPGLQLSPDVPMLGPELLLSMHEGTNPVQPAFAFVLDVIPVDRGGDEGESTPVLVADDGLPDGEDAGGCAGPGLPRAMLLGLPLLARGRTRRAVATGRSGQ